MILRDLLLLASITSLAPCARATPADTLDAALRATGYPMTAVVRRAALADGELSVDFSPETGPATTESRIAALSDAAREAFAGQPVRTIELTAGGRPLWEFLPPVPRVPPAEGPVPEGAVPGALSGKVIAISPGHGYYASSTTAWSLQRSYWYGIVEDFMNQEIMQNLYNLLANNGATVYVTREMDKTYGDCTTQFTFAGMDRSIPNKPWWQLAALYYVQRVGAPVSVSDNGRSNDYDRDIAARPLYANWRNVDIVVSLHNNATGAHTARGTVTLYDTSNGYANKDKNGVTGSNVGSLPLATKLQNKIIALMRANYQSNWRDLGLIASAGGYGENRIATRPAALVEGAFFDEPNDNKALQDENFRLLLAKAMYEGICDYFGVTPTYNTNVQGTAGTWGARKMTPAWSLKLDSRPDAAPACAAGWVYAVTSAGTLFAVPAVSSTGFTPGVARWAHALGGPVKARPSVYGDTVYSVTVGGKVVALNRLSGALRWTATVGSSGSLAASPCPMPDGNLIVASDNGRLYLLSQTDGSLIRYFPSSGSLGSLAGTPAAPGGMGVWVTSASGAVRLLSPDLTTVRWETVTGAPITTSPFVSARDGLVFVTGGKNAMYAWNAANGNPAPGWLGSGVNVGGPTQSSPWVSDGYAVLGRDDHALSGLLVSGTGYAPGLPVRPWGVREFTAPPVVAGDTIFAGSADGRFFALKRLTGATDPGTLWRVFDAASVGLPGQFLTAAALTGPTSADRAVAACSNGYLYAFPVTP